MKLHASDNELLDLAPGNLDSLSIMSRQTGPFLAALARLSALTRLELIDCYRVYHDYGPLHNLGLVELVLVNCPELLSAIFVPGALARLQKLHVEEDISWKSPDHNQDEQRQTEDKVRKLIFSLPHLQQISGLSSIILAAERHQLQQWQRMQTVDCMMTEHSILPTAGMRCWRRKRN